MSDWTEGCCGVLRGPSIIALVIKSPEALVLSGAVVSEISPAKWRPRVLFLIPWLQINNHGLSAVIIFLPSHSHIKIE